MYLLPMALTGLLLGMSAASVAPRLDSRQQSGTTTFTNPVTWQDLPDLEVIRVGDVFYYTSSTFAFSPGAPVHKSYDLVNWTPVSHSVPTLPFGSNYNLSATSRAYVKGIWASTLQYRASKDQFIWLGCIESSKTYIFTSPGGGALANSGEVSNWNWSQSSVINKCYYDAGMLIDEDDTIYVAYGNKKISVAQLSADGKTEVRSQVVYSASTTIEGSRMYKIKGFYYILPTKPATAEWVLRSKSPWGPYEQRVLVDNIAGPVSNAGAAHQGGFVDTKDGKWYYMAFMDAYPGGRIPVLAPITWSADNWPQLVKDGNRWGSSYPMPVKTAKTVPGPTGKENFEGTALSHEWEWNHNPDNTKWAMASGGGVVLKTATVTDDLFSARNTLTRRVLGPISIATFAIDISQMRDGDKAGAVLFRDKSAYIGVHKSGNNSQLVYATGVDLNGSWQTQGKGTVSATGPIVSGLTVYLRIRADVTPAFGQNPVRKAQFSYSLDGNSYTRLGGDYLLTNTWQFFSGYRYAVFNFATKALGGQVIVKSFSMDKA